jgi:hypothetical protein
MLTLDRFEQGELDTPQHDAVTEHVDACSLCAERFEQMRRPGPALRPPGTAERPAPISLRFLAAGAAMATAAALILVIWPTPQHASLRPGPEPAMSASPYTTSAAHEYGPASSIDLRLFSGSRSGDRIVNGDAVGLDEVLRVEARADGTGYLAIVVDSIERADADPDEGADDTGGVMPETFARVLQPATAVRPGDRPLSAVYDVSVDGLTTDERVIAVFCTEPFSLDPRELADGFEASELPSLPEDCTSREIRYVPWGRVASS